MTEGPYRISDRTLDLTITGYALLVTEPGCQPSWLNMPGTTDLFIAVFSTKEKAIDFAMEFGVYYDNIKQITDGPDFIDSIEGKARIIVDPYSHNGKVRFKEVFFDGEAQPQPI
jgi:hypothetical protein